MTTDKAASDNSSSSHNVTATAVSSSHIDSILVKCMETDVTDLAVIIYAVINFLLLPLYILVLYIGFRQWRRPGTTASHSDIITYHLALMEIIGVSGAAVFTHGYCGKNVVILFCGTCVLIVTHFGQTLFHTLCCVDRYVAVVHPITYLHLKERSGVKVRNISVWCVWLQCFGWTGVVIYYMPKYPVTLVLCFALVCLLVVSFCSLSVLCVLIHPGPGEAGGAKKRVDQSKKRAFYILLSLTGVLFLRFIGILSYFWMYVLVKTDLEILCVLLMVAIIVTMPSNLATPLLFIWRTGTLTCCRHNTQRT